MRPCGVTDRSGERRGECACALGVERERQRRMGPFDGNAMRWSRPRSRESKETFVASRMTTARRTFAALRDGSWDARRRSLPTSNPATGVSSLSGEPMWLAGLNALSSPQMVLDLRPTPPNDGLVRPRHRRLMGACCTLPWGQREEAPPRDLKRVEGVAKRHDDEIENTPLGPPRQARAFQLSVPRLPLRASRTHRLPVRAHRCRPRAPAAESN